MPPPRSGVTGNVSSSAAAAGSTGAACRATRSIASSSRVRDDRLDQVVERGQLERVDRRVVERRHEHDRRRALEPPQHARELEAVEPRHAHVEEHGVDRRAVAERDERLLGRRGRLHALDRGRGLEHAHEVLERGQLVVDREQLAQAARTPARNFGSVMTTVVPRPAAGLHLKPVALAEGGQQPAVHVAQPDARARRRRARRGRARDRSPRRRRTPAARRRCRGRSPRSPPARPRPGARRRGAPRSRPAAGARAPAARPAAPPGSTCTRTVSRFAEPRLLEPQVLLHVAQLVGHRDVSVLTRERVADELGELGQQLARLLRAASG